MEREMEEYMKRYERIGEVKVMDEATNGAHNEDMEVTSSDSRNKRRKVDSPETLHSRPFNFQLEIECRRVLNRSLSSAVSGNSDQVVSSLCSSNGSSEAVKDSFRTADLKDESLVTEIFKLNSLSRETTPSSEVSVDSERMEASTTTKKPALSSSRCKPAVSSKIPSARELEGFFSAAEKYEEKRFAEKYNYDIVKDVPLEGRYQWVKL